MFSKKEMCCLWKIGWNATVSQARLSLTLIHAESDTGKCGLEPVRLEKNNTTDTVTVLSSPSLPGIPHVSA